jgi:hypothetical protein
MLHAVNLHGVDRETIVGNVLKAQERKRRALDEYESASDELDWWLQGAKLAGISEMQIDEADKNSVPDDLFPPAEYFRDSGERPTLRQAIMAELRETPHDRVAVAGLAARLVARGWLSAENAHKRVSDLAGVMHGEEQLERVGRGVYRLHPRIAMLFDQTTALEAPVTEIAEAPITPVSHPSET